MLKYYQEEQKRFSGAYSWRVSHDREAELIYRKLKAHYKLRQALRFRGRWGGRCRLHEVVLPHDTSIGMIAHEVAHAIQLKKAGNVRTPGRHWHNKQHTNIMKRVLHHVEKHSSGWLEMQGRKDYRHMKSLERRGKPAVKPAIMPNEHVQILEGLK